MLLLLKRLLQPQQLPPLNPQILRRNNILPIRLPPITLRLKTLEHNRHLLAKLLAPHSLVLFLRDLHKGNAAACHFAPGLVVVAVRALLGVDESVFGGCGYLGVCEDGGGEDADVGVGVAAVEDVGVGAGGLEGDVGAVAAGLCRVRQDGEPVCGMFGRVWWMDLRSLWVSSWEMTRSCW